LLTPLSFHPVQKVFAASATMTEGLLSYFCHLVLEKAFLSSALRPLSESEGLASCDAVGDPDVEMADAGKEEGAQRRKRLPHQHSHQKSVEAVSSTSLLGQNRGRDLSGIHRKVTNSIQKKILIHTGKLRQRQVKGTDSRHRQSGEVYSLPSPFHEMGYFALRNDLVVQNISDLMAFLTSLLSGKPFLFP